VPEEGKDARARSDPTRVNDAAAAIDRGRTSSGKPLEPGVRSSLERKLGHDFSHVRIHTGREAAAAARSLGSTAFTAGADVGFAGGAYAPHTARGFRLLAHELAHVAQQEAAPPPPPARVTRPSEPSEREARAAAEAVASGRAFAPVAVPTARVARQEVEEAARETPRPSEGEAELRRRFDAEVESFRREQLDFARDRITLASRTIARQFDEMKKRPEDERPAHRTKITALERQLVQALQDSVGLLEKRIADLQTRAGRGEDVKAELAAAKRELDENRADVDTLGGAFTPEKGAAFEKVYETVLPGAACMRRAYEGIGALFTPEKSAEIQKDVETKAERERRRTGGNIDHFITVMDTVSAAKMAGPKVRARWSKRTRTWTPTLESIVRPRINTKVPAYYFFGLALAEAFHSVIVGVSTWGGAPVTLWCDQNGCQTVAGTLDAHARATAEGFETLRYGDWDTYVWQIVPPAEASLLTPPGVPR
jgi:Domain of unknown function (DUF4157)